MSAPRPRAAVSLDLVRREGARGPSPAKLSAHVRQIGKRLGLAGGSVTLLLCDDAEMTRLNDGRTRLSGLMEEKRVTLDERQSELKRMRTAAADISRNVKDLNELITQLDQAVKNAMAKAQALAAGSSKSIDHIIAIEELAGAEPPMPRPYAMAARADVSTPIAPGELEIRAAVRVTAAIK